MATYDELTANQKGVLNAFVTGIRGLVGGQARQNNHGDALKDDYIAQVSAILSSLNTAEIIPNASGLAGAADLTKEQILELIGHVQGILADYNTSEHRQAWVIACGPANMVG
jgi:hypothetical protein